MSKILVTGATGFVGQRLLDYLPERGHLARAAVRRASSSVDVKVDPIVVGEINGSTDWSRALQGVDVVVHLAARVHVMNETETDPLLAFREINTEGTRQLAEQAASLGVKRLVYLSTIKVNGEETFDKPFTASDPVNIPEDPYGQSKWEAEQLLKEIGERTGLEIVIIRPPLVYGPGVKANFLSLIKLARRGLPLPLSGIENRRTLVGLDNLVDLITTCCEHPAAAGQVFLAGDDETLSTPDLVRAISAALERKPRLFYFPPWLMQLGTRMLGKKAIWQRLAGSLAVDNSAAKQQLNWQPVSTLAEELMRTVQAMAQHEQ